MNKPMMVGHICNKMPDGSAIIMGIDNEWIVAFGVNPKIEMYINFCPFCGEVLYE